jgi:hypothetical protein
VQHLRDLETTRRYARLLVILLKAKATLIDQALDLHDRIIGALSTVRKSPRRGIPAELSDYDFLEAVLAPLR